MTSSRLFVSFETDRPVKLKDVLKLPGPANEKAVTSYGDVI
jgi:hypothetical protein